MTRSIFIFKSLTNDKVDAAISLGVSTLITGHQNLNPDVLAYAQSKNLQVYNEVGIFQGEELWHKYPDSRPVDRHGKFIDKINWYAGVCPNHPKVREEKLNLIKKLIGTYDIDGIWLDFIRYPCFWEEVRNSEITKYCFCKNCLSKFEIDVGGEPLGEKWTQWKCQQITNFVGEVKKIIDYKSPRVKLGLFAVPWKVVDYNGAIKHIIGQDLKQLSEYVDIFSPMTYHRFTGNKTSWIKEITTHIAKITNKPVLPLVQTEDRAGKISRKEFTDSIQLASLPPSDGAIIFFLEDLLNDTEKVSILQSA